MQLKYKLKNNTQLRNTKLVNIKKYRHNIQFSWNCSEMGSFASSQLSIDDFFILGIKSLPKDICTRSLTIGNLSQENNSKNKKKISLRYSTIIFMTRKWKTREHLVWMVGEWLSYGTISWWNIVFQLKWELWSAY